jgi:hypothetical protein
LICLGVMVPWYHGGMGPWWHGTMVYAPKFIHFETKLVLPPSLCMLCKLASLNSNLSLSQNRAMLAQSVNVNLGDWHERMARGGHRISKVSPGPAMANPSTPCGRATAEGATSGVAHPQGKRPAVVFYPLGQTHAVRLCGSVNLGDWTSVR